MCSSRVDDKVEIKPSKEGFQEVDKRSCRNFLDVLVVYDCSKTTVELSGVSIGLSAVFLQLKLRPVQNIHHSWHKTF